MTNGIKRFALLIASGVAICAGGLAVVRLAAPGFFSAHGRELLLTTQGLQAFIAANWVALGLGQTLIAASGIVPASAVAALAGATLGFVKGGALSIVCTLLGGWIAFGASRTVLRGFAERLIRRRPTLDLLSRSIEVEGWRLVALLRLSPAMPFAMTSYALGLTRISQGHFLLGTCACVPSVLGYVALGALGWRGLEMAEGGVDLRLLILLGVGAALVVYAAARVRAAMVRLAA